MSVVAGALDAKQILAESNGGIVVHVGCGTGELAASLAARKNCVVQALDREQNNVRQARELFDAKGISERASAVQLKDDALPYIDNLVNVLVVNDDRISEAEVMRVLVPNGIAFVNGKKLVKPRPDTIDEWTHYLHDPSNNAVAHDQEISSPRHYQWLGGPRWARHHDHLASLNAMVTARGRLYYIIDEGLTATILTKPDWQLICRDAFNGTVLWKQKIDKWFTQWFPLKSGPASLPRRLVADGDKLYVPLSLLAPVSLMDGRSGRVLRSYPGSEGTEEIIAIDELLVVLTIEGMPGVDPKPGKLGPEVEKNARVRDGRISISPLMRHLWAEVASKKWRDGKRTIRVYHADTGDELWAKGSTVMPLSLTVDSRNVYFHDGESVIALNRKDGTQAFRTEAVPVAGEFMQSFFGPTMVVEKDVLLFAGGEKLHQAWMGWGLGKEQGQDTMTAFSTSDGKKLWSAPHPYGGYQSPEDLFVIDDLVWTADTAVGGAKGAWIGRNLRTGEIEKEVPPDVKTGWFHHRCYRAKATDNFILPSRNGIECIDLDKKTWNINHWVRSGCLYGIMPANGLIYALPHNCACHPQAKLYGLSVLASPSKSRLSPKEVAADGRLYKGPAFGQVKGAPSAAGDWPLYRCGPDRGSTVDARIEGSLKKTWETNLGGKLTQAVAVGDLIIVAQVDSGTVNAVDAKSGNKVWSFTTGGRVDSAPSLHNGYVVFGSKDGYVYCLRANDGVLVWRFMAAPHDRRMSVFNNVESVWPVFGSVLVRDGTAWFTAGRSFHLDGGVWLYKLDVATGNVLNIRHYDSKSDAGQELQAKGGLDMPVALPDIISAEGDDFFMRSMLMDKDGNRKHGTKPHLFAPYGFVDDTWFHRAYWVYGDNYYGGCGGYPRAGKTYPSGRMIVADGDDVYTYGREQKYFRWISPMEFHLFAVKTSAPAPVSGKKKQRSKRRSGMKAQTQWDIKVPMLVRAMVKAGDQLILAGPPDLIDEEEMFQQIPKPEAISKIAEQEAAYHGEHGAILWVLSATDGKKVQELELSELPRFDGISVSGNRVLVSTEKGKLVCLQGK